MTPFARPWRAYEHIDPVDGWGIRDAYSIRVVSQLDEGTAHLIVRAVNNHEQLLEAATWALNYLSGDSPDYDYEEQYRLIDALQAAIQKASG